MEENIYKKFIDNIVSKTVLALIGIVGTAVTIIAFYQEKKAELKYEIVSNTNVLDFNADLSKLEVIYDSTNLKETNQNLRIFFVKITNDGDKDITKDYYDSNDPVGLKVNGGRIIENPELIKASNEYLSRNVKLVGDQKNNIIFSQVILEANEYFIVKVLVLHRKDAIPIIQAFGKIAGQKQIDVFSSIDTKKDFTFVQSTFGGNVWVQIVRLLSYFFAMIFIIIFIVIIFSKLDSHKISKNRNKFINDFKSLKAYQYTRMDDAIFDRYKNNSQVTLKKMQALLASESELNLEYKKLSDTLKSKEFRRFRSVDGAAYFNSTKNDWSLIRDMIIDGLVFKDEDKLNINQAMKDTLDKFIAYLEENGEYSKRGIINEPAAG